MGLDSKQQRYSKSGERRDGSNYAFSLNTDGSVAASNNSVADISAQFVNAAGGTINRATILSTGGQFTVKTTKGDQITLALFVPNWSNQFMAARPTQIVYRGGYTWNFTYGTRGEVLSITDSYARTISFVWNYTTNGDTSTLYPRAVRSISMPDGTVLVYEYENYSGQTSGSESWARLKTISRFGTNGSLADSTQLKYESTLSNLFLTGIINNAGIRSASWTYDSSGRVLTAQGANGADGISIAYSTSANKQNFYRTVTNALGKQTTFTFKAESGLAEPLLTGVVGTASPTCVGTTANNVFDSAGRVIAQTDQTGNVTKFTYGSDGRVQSKTEAFGTNLQRVTTYEWNDTIGVPTRISAPNLLTTLTYDSAGRILTRRESDQTQHTVPFSTYGRTRQWIYAYNSQGQLSSVDGPLTGTQDTTSYLYDAKGYLSGVTNAMGHAWTISATDLAGRPTSISDPNGVLTTVAYDGAGRPSSINEAGRSTIYQYNVTGRLSLASFSPSGTSIQFIYDDAGRLVELQDEIGNKIKRTLNLAGSPTKIEVRDATNTLRRSQDRVYDELNRLLKIQRPLGSETVFGYDLNGNSNSETVTGVGTTSSQFDALNRLFKVTNPLQGITSYDYDSKDRLTTVTDPRGVVTSYTVDGFGYTIRVSSPDSGITDSTFDLAGNLLSRTDAKGQTTSHAYDLIGRAITESSGATTRSYSYDQGSYGVGRLTAMQDSSGTTTWTYNADGNVSQKVQVTSGRSLATGYTYDAAGRLQNLTLPSGRVVTYSWNGSRIAGVSIDGQTFASTFVSQPFGGPSSWTFANGDWVDKTYDLDGRETSNSVAQLAYDSGNRITSLTHTGLSILSGTKAFGYNALDQLASYSGSGNGSNNNISYSYDATGNRLASTNNSGSQTYAYSGTSNRLLSTTYQGVTSNFTYDLNGSVLSDGLKTFAYDRFGQLSSAVSGANTASYQYNAQHQRVSKTVGTVTTLYTYDESGHLMGEYKANGTPITENVWMGDTPIGVLKPGERFYVHADHLNTPRQISNSTRNVVWLWDSLTFGFHAADQDPWNTGTEYRYNLRFPGQVFDPEIGVADNWMRSYSPTLGRYLQSDPIGLKGGVNTYAYVGGNPVSWIDPLGLSGTLVINSSGTHDGSMGSGGLSGHSWISYTPDGGSPTTYGTWGNNPNGLGNGLQQNLEAGRTGDATRSAHLDDAEEVRLNQIIGNYSNRGADGWKLSSPCSSFASEAWNGATGENLSPYGPYSNPSSLINSIINANGGVPHGQR